MKKVYTKPSVVVDTFLADDYTNLTFISANIAVKSGKLAGKYTKLNQ